MNGTQLKCLLVMMVLAIIGFGPLSLTCLIGMAFVVGRPHWFYLVVMNLYRDSNCEPTDCSPKHDDKGFDVTVVRIQCFLCLLVLLVLDIAPVPVTGSIGLYVVILRPPWFRALVEKMYCGIG